MKHEDERLDSADILKLVGQIYGSILDPEKFIEVLEIWDRTISTRDPMQDELFDLLEEQLAAAVPLLEQSLKDVVTSDELANRVHGQSRPSVLLSSDLMVIAANPSGAAWFRLNAGDHVNSQSLDPEARNKLADLARSAKTASGKDGFRIINFAVQDTRRDRREFLVAMKLVRTSHGNEGFILVSALELSLQRTGRVQFASAFGLTEAELSIIDLIVAGKRQKDIAEIRGIREDTVKKHLQSIRQKTMTDNATALICLIASFTQMASENNEVPSDAKAGRRSVSNRSDKVYTMPRSHKLAFLGGKQLEYVEFGSPSGFPVIINHSSMVGFSLPPAATDYLVARGMRVILAFRPGYGVSDRLDGEYSAERMAEHLLAFANVLGIERFAIVGGTVGFIIGAAMAHLAPHRVTSLIGVSPYLPISPQELSKNMAPYQRAVLFTLMKRRPLAKFMVVAGYKMQLQLGTYRFFRQLFSRAPADLAALENSNSLAHLTVGTRIAGAQGVDAVLDDSSLVLSDWNGFLDGKVPVHILHGKGDSVFSNELVREYCSRHDFIRFEDMGNLGQLMIYSDPLRVARLVHEAIAGDREH